MINTTEKKFGYGFPTLIRKEIKRFMRVFFQTIGAPALNAVLFLLVFNHVLASRPSVYHGVSYSDFLVPGLIMMSMLQNSFANTSSSLIQSRLSGNLIFMLLPPMSANEIVGAYIGAATIRGAMVGLAVWLVSLLLVPIAPYSLIWLVLIGVAASVFMGALGLVAGIWSERFDQMSVFQNFVVMPITFLSGVFYSVESLSPFWHFLSHINPIFYAIDGFRYAFFGVSDVNHWISLFVVVGFAVAAWCWAWYLVRIGYKLRS